MPPKNTAVSAVRSVAPRLNATQRRAAETTAIADKQARLKREAAQRRAERAQREAEAATPPRKNAGVRRPR